MACCGSRFATDASRVTGGGLAHPRPAFGLAAPILVNVVLAGVLQRDAGAAGGLLSTANQTGAVVGIAVLRTILFVAVDNASIGVSSAQVYGGGL